VQRFAINGVVILKYTEALESDSEGEEVEENLL
jgi:hypothetical protein